jgi:hypothetical protein
MHVEQVRSSDSPFNRTLNELEAEGVAVLLVLSPKKNDLARAIIIFHYLTLPE